MEHSLDEFRLKEKLFEKFESLEESWLNLSN
jgi:hypothetical protein